MPVNDVLKLYSLREWYGMSGEVTDEDGALLGPEDRMDMALTFLEMTLAKKLELAVADGKVEAVKFTEAYQPIVAGFRRRFEDVRKEASSAEAAVRTMALFNEFQQKLAEVEA